MKMLVDLSKTGKGRQGRQPKVKRRKEMQVKGQERMKQLVYQAYFLLKYHLNL